METIVLHITNNEDEYARATRAYQLKRGKTTRAYAIYFVLILVIILAYIYNQGMLDYPPAYLPILLTVFLFGAMVYTAPQRWKKQFREDPQNTRPFTWEVNEQGVRVISVRAAVPYGWPMFREALETEEFFILAFKQDPNQFLFAPKRVFESSEQMEQFRALLKAKVG